MQSAGTGFVSCLTPIKTLGVRLAGIDRISASPIRFNKKTLVQTLCGANTTIDFIATTPKEKNNL
jgi:hypothetical protein